MLAETIELETIAELELGDAEGVEVVVINTLDDNASEFDIDITLDVIALLEIVATMVLD